MYTQHKPITSWAAEDRPREKLLSRGIASLTDAEILAITLASGTRHLSAIGLARVLLDTFGGLEKLALCSVAELVKIKGIGPAKAMSIVSAFELSRRKALTNEKKVQIVTIPDAVNYLRPHLVDLKREVFYVVMLNRKNEVETEKVMFSGGISSTIVDVKLILKEAIDHLASAILVGHNHPSGFHDPSEADKKLTVKLKNACEVMDLTLVDHVIITEKGYYSFRESNLL